MPQTQEERMTFEYKFKYYNLYQNYYSFSSIGWEYWQHPQKYLIDNSNIPGGRYVFQYTVSGEGAITINSHTYTLKAGQAFLIELPGASRYFLPRGSSHWELKFVTLNAAGHDILNHIISEYGNIFTLPASCAVMDYWEELYRLSKSDEMNDFFHASIHAYTFIMHLSDTLRRLPNTRHFNNRIQICLDTIHANYEMPLTLKQLADICCLSPSYLTRTFKENFKVAPIRYLIHYRIEVACHLLQGELRIEDIARQTGFSSASYFSRIFKQVMGVSPKDYRHTEHQESLHRQEIQQLIVRYEVLE